MRPRISCREVCHAEGAKDETLRALMTVASGFLFDPRSGIAGAVSKRPQRVDQGLLERENGVEFFGAGKLLVSAEPLRKPQCLRRGLIPVRGGHDDGRNQLEAPRLIFAVD